MISKTRYTPTMAKYLTQQGYFEEAADVYRYLLERESGHPGYRNELESIEEKLSDGKRRLDRLADLMAEWIELTGRYGRLQRIRKLINGSGK
ncbi:MAG: hypothetical protein JRH15_04340 [Deltaproteobacteria bacterium]|nr:hypothetical protein [Deltaproteobacteria bacterium]